MITISLCMIVKNEENTLERCLASVKDFVDEIIIVDTGSADNTKEIASKFTDKIYDFDWVNDFSAARNFSFSKAEMDYQMWLDADDIFTEDDRNKMIKLKSELSGDVDVVTLKYNTHFDENNIPVFTSTRGRLFKRVSGYIWNDPIHEYVAMSGNIYHATEIFVTHKKESSYSDRNIKIYEQLVKDGKSLSPRSKYYFARELKDHRRYDEAIKYFNWFLDEGLGWSEDNIAACFNLNVCYCALNRNTEGLEALLKSFKYDSPRAEICCEIGYYFKNLKDNDTAEFWFLLSTNLRRKETMSFVLNDYWGYIPNIELAVCYSLNKDIEKAVYHNNLAKQFKPNSLAVKHNEKYFESLSLY